MCRLGTTKQAHMLHDLMVAGVVPRDWEQKGLGIPQPHHRLEDLPSQEAACGEDSAELWDHRPAHAKSPVKEGC